MNPDPSISVVIPCFNAGKLLRRALQSVRNQTFQPLQTIVVDDGSSDCSSDLVEAEFPEVTLLKNDQNRGVSASRNRGAAEAQGEYIAFLDADDSWRDDKLEHQARVMRTADYDLYMSGFYDVRATIRRWGKRVEAGLLCEALGRGIPFNSSTVIIARRAFNAAGRYDSSMRNGEDMEFIYRLALHGAKVYFDPEPLAFYHHDNKQSLTQLRRNKLRFSTLRNSLRDAAQHCNADHFNSVLESATRHFNGHVLRSLFTKKRDRTFEDDLFRHGVGRSTILTKWASLLPTFLGRLLAVPLLVQHQHRMQRHIRSVRTVGQQ